MPNENYRTMRQSFLFLLFAACETVFPGKMPSVHQSVNRSTYCEIPGLIPTEEDLAKLEACMRAHIRESLSLTPVSYPKEEAIRLIRESGDVQSAEHLTYSTRSHLNLLKIGKKYYSVYGSVFPHAGYLSDFELVLFEAGFLLRYPHPVTGMKLLPFHAGKKILKTVSEYQAWSDVIGVSSVYELNRLIREEKIADCINISEIMHEKQLSRIADTILGNILRKKVILISGPSSSGKTTTTTRLMLHLRANGLSPRMISLDDYYYDKDKAPLDDDGKPNYEDIEAIDYQLFNRHLLALLGGEEVTVPRFDFQKGKRAEKGRTMSLPEGTVLLVEGIHALNEKLVRGIPSAYLYRIYLSALTVLCFDRYNPISPTDTRLLRRMIRDSQFRNTDAVGTLSMWGDVLRGETKNIYPYEDTADVIFNTSLSYEFAVYREKAEPLLTAALSHPEHKAQAERLLEFIRNFEPLSESMVPGTSLIREFIGGSTLLHP